MKDKDDTPFWGKQKPLKHYFHNGVMSFIVRKGELWIVVKRIDKSGHYPLYSDKVKDKEHLDRLLRVKSIEYVAHLV